VVEKLLPKVLNLFLHRSFKLRLIKSEMSEFAPEEFVLLVTLVQIQIHPIPSTRIRGT
jgi:hypothetical protein